MPATGMNMFRWTLGWRDRETQINFRMHLTAELEGRGLTGRIAKMTVERRAASPLDYEGHTPTTRLRQVHDLAIESVREAILAEWP